MKSFIEKIFFIHDSQLVKKSTYYGASISLIFGIVFVALSFFLYFYIQPYLDKIILQIAQNSDFLVQYATTVTGSDKLKLTFIAMLFNNTIPLIEERAVHTMIFVMIIGILFISYALLSRKAHKMSLELKQLREKKQIDKCIKE